MAIGFLIHIDTEATQNLVKRDNMDFVRINERSIDIKQQAGFRRGQQILGLSVNVKAEVFIQTGQKELHSFAVKGNAAFGWFKTWPRQMDKNGAASAGNSRLSIPIRLYDNVIKAIIPPKLFVGAGTRQGNGAVVTR